MRSRPAAGRARHHEVLARFDDQDTRLNWQARNDRVARGRVVFADAAGEHERRGASVHVKAPAITSAARATNISIAKARCARHRGGGRADLAHVVAQS